MVNRLLPLVVCLPMLAACGAKAPVLSDDPIDRAATCGVVAAAGARSEVKNVAAPIPLAAHGRIVHYTLLAASQGGTYTPETPGAVSRRMVALEAAAEQWKKLDPACRAAFPAAERTEVALPEDGFDAQLQCSELGEFLYTALEAHLADYRNEIVGFRNLHLRLDEKLAPALLARAGKDFERKRALRHRALAAAGALGTPTAVMARCMERFD